MTTTGVSTTNGLLATKGAMTRGRRWPRGGLEGGFEKGDVVALAVVWSLDDDWCIGREHDLDEQAGVDLALADRGVAIAPRVELVA